ncbi:glycosyltransferase family 32 protein [Pedobacter xixiisoli]|uniref:Glycosyltransferase sugar-binding region containing DXD motif-containing protein n=1 Tax=Pedobacter xixiisoli TaxID=1476464 RepID=A0A286ACJ1_9SPHI|nr:glycosyltransferase [Pedobacter xixiisoli]SOD19613.1 Glycosyltransferase sugar-binding region containing DXD motif-containing protein [Pedobacter xixiisoli]
MIAKIIHYCWFGRGTMPELALKCLESWKTHLPEYEIVEWNEDNFDVNMYRFSSEAYKERKFAFVADVCRLYALKNMGGIYLDTDVEFLRPLSEEMLSQEAFTGFEDNLLLSSAIMGSEKDGKWINDLLPYYDNRSFYLKDGSHDVNPNTEIITEFMKTRKSVSINNTFQKLDGYCTIYPSDYFCPKSWKTLKIKQTPNTYCIHHFAGSWLHKKQSLIGKLANFLLGKRIANAWSEKYRNKKKI